MRLTLSSLMRRRRTPLNKVYITPPRASADRAGIAIPAILKNEETIIREWLLHNSNIGVRHFFLYDNGSTDRTIEIATTTLGAGSVTIIPWKLKVSTSRDDGFIHQQLLAFCHAIQTFGCDFQYMAFLDPDEFLIPLDGLSFEDALSNAGCPANLAIPWTMFGRNGHLTPPRGGVGANYLMRPRDRFSDRLLAKFKCIVDPCAVTVAGVHAFETMSDGNRCSNDSGYKTENKKRFSPEFLSGNKLQLNHYYTRSASELDAKLKRSSNQAINEPKYAARAMSRVARMEADTIEDRALLDLRSRAPDKEWV